MQIPRNRLAYLASLVLLSLLGAVLSVPPPMHPVKAPGIAPLSSVPLSFEVNQGQTDPRVNFLARAPGSTLFFTPTESVLALSQGHVVRMKLVGGNPHSTFEALDELPGKTNYYIGNDPAKWHTQVAHYSKVRYREVYPSIDLVFYGNQGRLEYDFIVAPGADPESIRLEYEGAEEMHLTAEGDLLLSSSRGEVRYRKPEVYQELEGIRRPVGARYTLRGKNQAAFDVDRYDPARPLVIDPVLSYSTYLGGSSLQSEDCGIAVDGSGNIYVAGTTLSADFPTRNAVQTTKSSASSDAFIIKLNPAGNTILYSTFLGGGGQATQAAKAVAVDPQGQAIVAGETSSPSFPTTAGAFQTRHGGRFDAFVVRLTAVGSLLFATFLGGGQPDGARAVAVDSSGAVYVTGETSSVDFPVANAFQPVHRATGVCVSSAETSTGFVISVDIDCRSAFVSKLSASGTSLLYSTYLGGTTAGGSRFVYTRGDEGRGIAVDAEGNAFIVGATISADFPVTSGVVQTRSGGLRDAFITKLNSAGNALLYSTYLGGANQDVAQGVAIDASGNAYLAGESASTNFPTANPLFAANRGGGDAFVAKLNPAGSALLYSTYLGGAAREEAVAVAVDASESAFLVGRTFSSDFPALNSMQGNMAGRTDGFVARLNGSGSALLYSTFLGGSDRDRAESIAVDPSGTAFVAGYTSSTDFPMASPLQGRKAGFTDTFIVRIVDTPAIPPVTSVSAASFTGTSLAPDSIVSAFGQGLATSTEAARSIPLPTALGGATVRITDRAGVERVAPLFFASPNQINFLLPPETARGQGTVTVKQGDRTAATGRVEVEPVAPGLFTANASGRGVAAALVLRVAADGAQTVTPVFQCGSAPGSCTGVPIDLGAETDQSFLLLFGTGIRGFSRPAVAVTIGGEAAEVLGAGAQGQFVGLDQVNVRVSRRLLGRGEVNVVLTVDGRPSNTVTIRIGGSAAAGSSPASRSN